VVSNLIRCVPNHICHTSNTIHQRSHDQHTTCSMLHCPNLRNKQDNLDWVGTRQHANRIPKAYNISFLSLDQLNLNVPGCMPKAIRLR